MQQSGRVEICVSDEDSYSSSSGSCSEVESQSSASQSLAGHVEDASVSHQSRSSIASGKQSALGPEGSQAAQAAASTQPPDQFESPTEKEDPLDRSEGIRRLSQSVLAVSSNLLTHSTDEDSPHLLHHVATCQLQSADIAAADRMTSGASLDAASGRYEAEEPEKGTGANDAPSSEHQSSFYRGQALTQDTDRPGGKQARLQLEDMLTRIELHFQAEKSARLEAEARCAAALEALRRVGHPHSMPPVLPANRQLPDSLVDGAREGITAARSLVASVCTVLEELEVVRQRAHHIQTTMNNLLQELPDTSAGLGLSQGHDSARADHLAAMDNAQPQPVQPGWPGRLKVGLRSAGAGKPPPMTRATVQASKGPEERTNPEQPGIASASHMPAQLPMGRAVRGMTGVPNIGPLQRGSPVYLTPAGHRALPLQNGTLNSTRGPKQRPGLPVASARDVSPQRKQLEQPQRWETSTKSSRQFDEAR